MHSGPKSFPQDAPKAAKKPHSLEKHGDIRVDNYFWLKERENPEVISHLTKENEYVDRAMKRTEDLQTELFEEMKGRIKEDDSSVPFRRGNFYYYTRMEKGKQYPIHARKKDSLDAPEEVLIDDNKLAEGHSFLQCSGPMMSPDQKAMAYSCDYTGRRFYDLKVKDVATGKDLGVDLRKIQASVIWSSDGQHFFYVKQHPETLRSQWVYRYDMKTHKSTLIHEEKDETFITYITRSLGRKHLFVGSYSTLTTEIRYLPLDKPTEKLKVFLPREREHRYSVIDGVDRFYVLTNWKAKNNRLMEAPLNDTDRKNWKDVIPHREDVYLDDVEVFKNHLVLTEREKGQDRLRIKERVGKTDFIVPVKDASYVIGLTGNAEFETPFLRYEYESMRQPETTYDLDFRTLQAKVVKVKEVPGFNPEKYKTEKIWIQARDGTQVPVDLLMKADVAADGKAPMLVYGYGSYGASMGPWFSSTIFNMVDRGWVYAMTHIRGGRELGEDWYNNGRTHKKINTFTDFIDTTKSLVKLGYADPKRVYARGGSAGGLLMGAVMNMEPTLYHGIVAEVPFVDVITTMLDDSIPLTTGEYDEWGNPNVKKDYDYIRRYSPYDNLKAGPYPHLLATTGLHDSQVQYWEPAKWVAKIRDLKTNDSLILMKTDMTSGHGGASGRYEALKEEAVVQAFLLMIDP